MVGRWVKIKQDAEGTEWRDGMLSSYNSTDGKYEVNYVDGSTHSKSLHSLQQWFLLPHLLEQLPMTIVFRRIACAQLDGLQGESRHSTRHDKTTTFIEYIHKYTHAYVCVTI